MAITIYPYRRIITREYLEERKFPPSLIDNTLNGMGFSFHYQAALLPRRLIIMSEKNAPIDDLIVKISGWHGKEIAPQDRITIVQHSPDFRKLFAPQGIELGELEELDDKDYSVFDDSIQRLNTP